MRAILTWNSWDTFCVSPNVLARYYQNKLLRAIHQQPFPYNNNNKNCDSNASQNHSKTEPQSKKLSSEWWCQWLINKIPLRLTFANQVFSWISPPPLPPPSNIPGLKHRRKTEVFYFYFGCMVVECTQNLRWDGSISHGTSHATTRECYQHTISVDINNTHQERIQSLVQDHMRHVHSVCSRAVNSAI